MKPIRFPSFTKYWEKLLESQVARQVYANEYYRLWKKVHQQVSWNETINPKLPYQE